MQTFESLFGGATHKHGILKTYDWNEVDPKTGKIKKIAKARPGKPNYQNHLNGTQKIGVYTTFDEDRCKFGTLDIDEYDIDLKALNKRIQELKLPCVVCRSSNGGGHLHFHFEKPVPSYKLHKKLHELGRELGYAYEPFPKQARVEPGTDGNFVYLPLFPKRPNAEKRILEPVCDTYGLDDKDNILADAKSYEEYANSKLLKRVEDIVVVKKPQEEVNDIKVDLRDAPPCVSAMYKERLKGGSGNGRNEAMFAFATFERKRKGSVTMKDLKHYNETFGDPLPHNELGTILSQVKNPKYKFYNCNAQTLVNRCNKEACKLMKFGIGKESKTDLSYYENFIFIKDGGPWVVKLRPMRKMLKPADAKQIMMVELGWQIRGKERVHPYAIYEDRLANMLSANDAEWHPGKPSLYEKRGYDGTTIKVYNDFNGSTLEAIEGDVSPFIDFIENRFHDDECRNWFLNVLAHVVQKPQERLMSFILLISDEEGTGKSFIDEIMQAILGIHNCNNIDLKDLATGWGDLIVNKLWLSFEEIHDVGDKRVAVENTIKRFTTIKTIDGNMKYGKFKQAQVYARLMFMTNVGTALRIRKKARRPFVYRLDNDKKELEAENHAEGNLLADWIKNDQGVEKIFHYLKTRDISKFDPTKRPPETKAKAEMVRRTYGYKYGKVLTAWEMKAWPFTAQSSVYCPRWIAKILNVDEEEIDDFFKETLDCKFLKRVQNCEFEIWSDQNSSETKYRVDASRMDLQLWTDDQELLAMKEELKPKDVIAQYLHPCKTGASKVFAQDRRVNKNLINKLNELD